MLQNKSITLVIVDDHPIVIEGVKILLKETNKIKIIGAFRNAASFESFLGRNEIDIVLLDIVLPDSNGIELCKKIKLLSQKTKVLALSNQTERNVIMKMIQNGANGYLLKNIASKELISCVLGAAQGDIMFSKQISDIMVNPKANELKTQPRVTKREQEILQLLSKGLTTHEIADQLFVSPLTIETHRRNLISKFEVKNAVELIMEASQYKLV